MTSHHLKKELRRLKTITPNPSWTSARRDLLLRQVSAQVGKPSEKVGAQKVWEGLAVFRIASIGTFEAVAARGMASAVLSLVFLLGLGGYVVSAAERSLPGERLYGVKVVLEDAQLRLATSPRDRVALEIEFADRRLDELALLTARDGQSQHVPALVSQFESRMTNAATTIASVTKDHPSEGAEIARLFDARIAEYEHSLVEAKEGLSNDDSRRVDQARVAVIRAETQALKAIVDDASVPKDEVAKKIDEKIKVAEESLKVADEKLAGGTKSDAVTQAQEQSSVAKDNLAAAKQKATEGDYRAAIGLLEGVEDLVVEVQQSVLVQEDEAQAETPAGEVQGETDTQTDGGNTSPETNTP